MRFPACLVVLLTVGIACVAWAEDELAPSEIHLKSGEVVTGKIVKDEPEAVTVRVEMMLKSGKTMSADTVYKRELIERIVAKPAASDEYATRLAAVGPTADDHAALAAWCQENGLHAQAIEQAKAALAIDQADSVATKLLEGAGWAQVDGAWLSPDELKAKGLVVADGRVMTTTEADQFKAKNQKRILRDAAKRALDEADGSVRKLTSELEKAKGKQIAAEKSARDSAADAEKAKRAAADGVAKVASAEAALKSARDALATANANANANTGATAGAGANNSTSAVTTARQRVTDAQAALATATKERSQAQREANAPNRAAAREAEAAKAKKNAEDTQARLTKVTAEQANLQAKLKDAQAALDAEQKAAEAQPAAK